MRLIRLIQGPFRASPIALRLALVLGLLLQAVPMAAAPSAHWPEWLAEAICGPGTSLPQGQAHAHDHPQCCMAPAVEPTAPAAPGPAGSATRIDPPARGAAPADRATPPACARDPPVSA